MRKSLKCFEGCTVTLPSRIQNRIQTVLVYIRILRIAEPRKIISISLEENNNVELKIKQ